MINNLIKKIKIKYDDETYSDYIPIGAEAQNVTMDNNRSVQEIIGNIDIEKDGNIEKQLNILNKENNIDKIKDSLVCSIAYRDCTEYVKGDTDETLPIEGYLQGFTTTPTTFLNAYQTGGSYENKTNMIYLKEISKSTGEVLRTAYLELYHANALAYNEKAKEIYVAANSYRDDNFKLHDKNEIIVVDYDTFVIKNIITPPTEIISKHRVRSVSYDNKNQVLALADTKDIWIMRNWKTIEKHIELDLSYTAPDTNPLYNYITNQNTIVFDNKIYSTRFFANGIVVFDMEGQLIKNYYNLDVDIPVQIGELESIAIEDNGILYLASEQIASSNNSVGKFYDRTIFKTNLIYGGYKNYYLGANIDASVGFYVDASTNNMYQAGTEKAPFKHIQQAIMACDTVNRKTRSIIYLKNNQTYGMLVCKSEKPIYIGSSGGKSIIKTAWIQHSNIIFENIIFELTKLINLNSEANPANVLVNDNSLIHFHNCNFLNTDSNNIKESGLIVNRSEIYLKDCIFDNLNNIIRMIDLSTLYLQGATINNCNYYWYIDYNCTINYRSNAILQKLNPNSKSIPYTPFDTQLIDYVFENNVLTLTNSLVNDVRPFHITFRSILDGVEYTDFLFTIGGNQQNLSFINSAKTYKYDVYINMTYPSSRVYNFYITALKTEISTGKITDITGSSSFNITAVRRG